MKTININLIGELDKSPEYNKTVIKRDNLNVGTKIFVVVFIVAIFVTFVVSFATWLVTNGLNHKHRPELSKLKTEHQKLSDKEAELTKFKRNLQKNIEVAKFKLLAKEQIDKTFVPWSLVLKDLATKVPTNIVVLDIDKTSRGGGFVNELRISGLVPAYKKTSRGRVKIKPITAISFFILNINEDKDSLLSNAKIGRIEYNDERDIYEFEIKANVSSSKDSSKSSKK